MPDVEGPNGGLVAREGSEEGAQPASDCIASNPPWRCVETFIPQGFRLTATGLYREKENSNDRVSGPVWVSAKTRDPQGGEWGLVIEWIDPDGKAHMRAFPRDLLHDRRGIELVQSLTAGGLEVIPGCENALVKYLGSFDVPNRQRAVAQLGWLIGEQLAYVLPDRVIGAGESLGIVYQPERYSQTAATMQRRGTLPQWQKNVAEACVGNAHLLFALSAAFVGPLLKFTNMESGGFHLYGASSTGKTTALQCAASVWGNGADPAASDTSYIDRWNTTGNALEAIAAAHNDGLLLLDELGTCSAQDFGKVVYDLFGGQGKARLGKDALLTSRRSWRVFGLSTGEVSVRQRIEREAGRAVHAGQMIRLIDIRVDEGLIRQTHGKAPAAFVKKLKESCASYHGTAGPACLDAFIAFYGTREDAARDIRQRVEAWMQGAREPGLELSGLQERGLQRFALVAVAGKLAVDLKILPLDGEEIDRAILTIAHDWRDDAANLSDGERGVRSVREFLQRHGSSRFGSWESRDPISIRDCAGYRTGEYFLFTDAGFKEACGAYEQRQVAEELKKRGFLVVDDPARFKSKQTLAGYGQRQRFYKVRDRILDDE